MDDTLIHKPKGAYNRKDTSLRTSPCFQPLLRWLCGGGYLVVVTADDGIRPFKALWNDVPVELRGRLMIATSDGAALFRCANQKIPGDVKEDLEFRAFLAERLKRVEEGVTTANVGEMPEEVVEAARQMLLEFLDDFETDPQLRLRLPRTLAEQYETLLQSVKTANESLRRVLSIERLASPGQVLPRVTMLWRNQTGPITKWVREGPPTGPWYGYYGKSAYYSSLWLSGLPKSVSVKYVSKLNKVLLPMGFIASSAPRSVCIKRTTVNKGTVVEYLESRPELQFTRSRAIAFGDNPLGNDKPLTLLSDLPFVNVAPFTDTKAHQYHVPAGGGGVDDTTRTREGVWHVGGCEHGTARVFEHLLALASPGPLSSSSSSASCVRTFSSMPASDEACFQLSEGDVSLARLRDAVARAGAEVRKLAAGKEARL